MLKCILNCEINPKTIFFRFPVKDEEIMSIWKQNLNLDDNFKPNYSHRICNAHFVDKYLGIRRIKKGAIPTLLLGHSLNVCEEFHSRKCAIANCVHKEKPMRFFPFPKDPQLCRIWKTKCGIVADGVTTKLYLCNNHFEPIDVGQKRLKKKTIPTRNLASSEMDIETPYHTKAAAGVHERRKLDDCDMTVEESTSFSRASQITNNTMLSNAEEKKQETATQCSCGWALKYAKEQRVFQQKMHSLQRKNAALQKRVVMLKSELKKNIVANCDAS